MTKIVEICVDTFESFVNAQSGGANRIELCSALSEGGLTPSVGFLKAIQHINSTKIPIFCMLRCRGGYDFNYSDEELDIMVEDAKLLKQAGADGFVFGALTDVCEIDIKKCREIIKTCFPMPVTFHRAFDVCKNPLIALETVIDIGFKRVLTSGQATNALDGAENIKNYIEKAKDRIVIMAGCGIDENNLPRILEITGCTEVHGSASVLKQLDLGDNCVFKNDKLKVTDSKKVQQWIKILSDY